MSERLHRTELLLGPEAVERLRAAHVTVCGLGAVGSFALEALARAGVGRLRVVDFDVVHTSNINRQLLALVDTVGRHKTELASARVRAINPDCRVEALKVFIDDATAPGLVADTDAVIDAIDSVNPKASLLAAAKASGARLVISCMGAANKLDPFAIRVDDLSQTRQCPLARWMRKRLRRRGVEGGIRCVYSMEPPRPAHPLAREAPHEVRPCDRGRIRRPLGSLGCITGIFGLVAARETILTIAGVDP